MTAWLSIFIIQYLKQSYFSNKHSRLLSNTIPKLTTSVKKVFDSMISLESDKMTALEYITFTFMRHSEIAYKTEQLL